MRDDKAVPIPKGEEEGSMKPRSSEEIRGMGQEISASVHVGKNGITEGLVEELRKQLKERKVVKVKVLPGAESGKREIAEELAKKTGSELIEVRGNTVLLCNRSIFKGKLDSKKSG